MVSSRFDIGIYCSDEGVVSGNCSEKRLLILCDVDDDEEDADDDDDDDDDDNDVDNVKEDIAKVARE